MQSRSREDCLHQSKLPLVPQNVNQPLVKSQEKSSLGVHQQKRAQHRTGEHFGDNIHRGEGKV